jgi:hypothetical protein
LLFKLFAVFRKDEDEDVTTYRKLKGLDYPINVARNIAREAANTYFIFSCDIELYPSTGITKKFEYFNCLIIWEY